MAGLTPSSAAWYLADDQGQSPHLDVIVAPLYRAQDVQVIASFVGRRVHPLVFRDKLTEDGPAKAVGEHEDG